ncbi:MAG: RluA family pseudouridine synthase [Verrucomicrobiota bacterium JB024]|nr:RluA family pseudouridine synthase [Verrucomicrobiota bacterium JB024]
MPEPIAFMVPEGVERERADRILAENFPNFSRSRLQKSFDRGEVLFKGEPIKKKHPLEAGDILSLVLPEPPPSSVEPVDLGIKLLYQDEHIAVALKPCGVITHGGPGIEEPTLCHGMMHACGGVLSRASGDLRPGIVHRLDKETSGAIVFAKTDVAFFKLVEGFSGRQIRKEYLAIVTGNPPQESGTIQLPIDRHPGNRTRMAVVEGGRPAHTDWKVEEHFGHHHTLVRCFLHTGRTHQIRVHLSHMGRPILGDVTYGYRPKPGEKAPPHFFLHAQILGFAHPVTGEPLLFEAPLPEAFTAQMERLRALG